MKSFLIGLVTCIVLVGIVAAILDSVSVSVRERTDTRYTHVRL